MILNLAIFTATIAAAKTKAAGNASILRAIERAVIEITKAPYWSFDGQTLVIISTTSKKRYVVDVAHTCEANSKTCKHHIARLLMVRYSERLAAAEAVAHEVTDRGALISRINAAWSGKYTSAGISQGLTRRFGVNSLAMLPTHDLQAIVAVLK